MLSLSHRHEMFRVLRPSLLWHHTGDRFTQASQIKDRAAGLHKGKPVHSGVRRLRVWHR